MNKDFNTFLLEYFAVLSQYWDELIAEMTPEDRVEIFPTFNDFAFEVYCTIE